MNLGEAVELGKNLPGGDNYSQGGGVGSKQEDNENIKASKEVSCWLLSLCGRMWPRVRLKAWINHELDAGPVLPSLPVFSIPLCVSVFCFCIVCFCSVLLSLFLPSLLLLPGEKNNRSFLSGAWCISDLLR